ncbi:MAG: Arginine N-methyltransferase 2 [Pycnora praestabilis]|nr:MAG: Arginine N-methyltransferase 2 [Pycnora praestabilis]
MATDQNPELGAQMILLASSQHDLPNLRTLLRHGSANAQDPETGFTPLHAAIAACRPDDDELTATQTAGHIKNKTKGYTDGETPQAEEELEAATKTVKLLLQNGAIWNDLDKNDETPGCLAQRLRLNELYEIMVDAGVRAELLLNRLDEYEPLDDGEEEEEDDDDETEGKDEEAMESVTETTLEQQPHSTTSTSPSHDPSTIIPTPHDPAPPPPPPPPPPMTTTLDAQTFLTTPLTITPTRILSTPSSAAVMMSWETPLMAQTADLLLPHRGLRVLNIGHGMGIIDRLFQDKKPSAHHIIEAHPEVLARMKETGWTTTTTAVEAPPTGGGRSEGSITVHAGRWQTVLPLLISQNLTFDAIYFDTFAEDYKAFKHFFTEYVIALLDPATAGDDDGGGGSSSRWSFFHGLGADRQVCYDVYTKVVEMDLFDAGFETQWLDVEVEPLERGGEEEGDGSGWGGVERPYWVCERYRLPICKFLD